MRPLATRLARVIGLAVLLYSLVILLGTIVGALGGAVSDTPWLLILVIAVGAVGLAGSIVFLLSLDGPRDCGGRLARRAAGWTGMMIAAVLPTSWLYLIAPVTLLGGLALLIPPHASAVDEQRPNLNSG